MKTLQSAILDNLVNALRKDRNAIQSPDCLKHSIMRAQMCAHWAKAITPQFAARFNGQQILEMCHLAFDNAVDEIYTEATLPVA